MMIIYLFVYVNRSRTIIKSCVAANIIFFHRELCLESVFLWSPSMSVTKIKSDKKMPFTTYLSPPFLAGLLAVSKILYTFCSFLGMIIMSIRRIMYIPTWNSTQKHLITENTVIIHLKSKPLTTSRICNYGVLSRRSHVWSIRLELLSEFFTSILGYALYLVIFD